MHSEREPIMAISIKNIVRFIVVLAALMVVGVVTPADKADAAPKSDCVYIGHTSGFVHSGEEFSTDNFDWSNTIHEYRCTNSRGMRIMKMYANSQGEYTELAAMASEDSKPKSPIVVCPKGEGRWYAIDLAYYYFGFIKKMNDAERKDYAGWVTKHAKQNNCEIYK